MLLCESPKSSEERDSDIIQVLVITTNHRLRTEMASKLKYSYFSVTFSESFEDVRTKLLANAFDICIIDMNMTARNAFHICSSIVSATSFVEVVLISYSASPKDIVEGFSCGAADVITGMHLDMDVMAARLRRITRHRRPTSSTRRSHEVVLRHGPILLYPSRYSAFVDNRTIALSVREFRILCYLVANPSRVASRRDIALACVQHEHDLSDRAVDNIMFRLRKKLGEYGALIHSVRGVGYSLTEAV